MRQILNQKREQLTRLTGNERTVLKMLLDNSRTTDVEIGLKLKVSSQAASKIRKKLEKIGLIKKYVVSIDYQKLGLTTFALAMLEVTPYELLENNFEIKSKNILGLYKVLKNGITHVALFGFKSMNELDQHITQIQTDYNENLKIKNMYIFPSQNLEKYSSKGLFKNMVKEFGKEKNPLPLDFQYYSEEKRNLEPKKINENEKKVIKNLLSNSKISYQKIGREIIDKKITSRGISKIKDRLETKGIIKDYSIKLNYDLLGIKIFAFLFIKKKPMYWKLKEAMLKWAIKSDNVIGCYKLNENSLHVIFCAFRNLSELEEYYHSLQSKNSEIIDIEKIYITSSKGVIRESDSEVLETILR